MTNDPISSELLARVVAGEGSAEEVAEVERWASSDRAHRDQLNQLRAVWATRAGDGDWDVDQAWIKVRSRLGDQGASSPSGPWAPAASGRQRFGVILQMAAVVAIVAGLGFAWRIFRPISPVATIYTTGVAERRSVDLPDGTRVELGPLSTMTVARGFGRGARTVSFSGEGTFTVVHDEVNPFRVLALGSVTEDLGTTFVLRAIESEAAVRLFLIEGAASFRSEEADPGTAVTLGPDDIGVLRVGERDAAVTRSVDRRTADAMEPGLFVADNATVDSALAELNRWSSRPIRLADGSLGSRRFTATLSLDDPIEALAILTLTLGLTASESPDSIVLR